MRFFDDVESDHKMFIVLFIAAAVVLSSLVVTVTIYNLNRNATCKSVITDLAKEQNVAVLQMVEKVCR